jgi:flagellar assembly protein FliH
MPAPAKFLFDLDFAAKAAPPDTLPLAEHHARLAEAESAGYAKGFAAGQAEARAETARKLALALEKITERIERIGNGLTGIEARLEAEAVDVAVAVARKLAPTLIAREPLGEIAALVTECVRHLTAAPHIAIRVSDALYDSAQAQLTDIAGRLGFQGRLVILADPELAEGDCRVEWADGGITRDRAATEAAVADTVGRFVTARLAAAGTIAKGEQQ